MYPFTKYRCLLALWGLLSLLSCGLLQAQTRQGIRGSVRLPEGPGGYATVALQRVEDSSVVQATVADEQGQFAFQGLAPGRYRLYAQLLGYRRSYSDTLDYRGQPLTELRLQLLPEVLSLSAVEIEAEVKKVVVEQKADRVVLNVENSVLSSGVTALEVLRRAPGVTVTQDGTVRLKGRDGVMVMMNGKASYLEGAELANLLKSLPADLIRSIEVMGNPSAKYDAEGNAGVINLVMKKAATDGLKGSLTGSYGQGFFPKAAGGGTLTYRRDRLEFTTGLQYNYKENYTDYWLARSRVPQPGLPSRLNSDYQEREPTHATNALFNMVYQAREGGSLSLNLLGNVNWGRVSGQGNSLYFSPEGQTLNSFRSLTTGERLNYNLNLNGGYKQLYDTAGSFSELSAGYTRYDQYNRQQLQTFSRDSASAPPVESLTEQLIPSDQHLAFVGWDHSHFFGRAWQLEAGLKYNYIRTDNDNRTRSFGTSISEQANRFVYTEHIAAGYLLLSKSLKQWKFQAGLRLEYTHTLGQQRSQGSSFRRSYLSPFPSASISYSPSQNTSLSLSYARKIDRPNYNNVNPFVYLSDPLNGYGGNPELLPQFTENAELGLSLLQGALYLSANYAYTAQPITDIWRVNAGDLGSAYTFKNLSSFQTAGLSLAVNLPITKWWTTSNFLYGFYNQVVGDAGLGSLTQANFSFMFNSTQTFTLPWKLVLELSGSYDSPVVYGIMRYTHLGQLSAGLQKRLWKDRITLRFSYSDVFWSQRYAGTGQTGEVALRDFYRWDNRVFFATLTFHFGKLFDSGETDEAPETLIERAAPSGR